MAGFLGRMGDEGGAGGDAFEAGLGLLDIGEGDHGEIVTRFWDWGKGGVILG